MRVSREKDVLFWDRCVLFRERSNAQIVAKGATDYSNTIRIRKGEKGRGCFLTVDWSSQQLVLANIRIWPAAVSDDRRQVDLWLIDHSQGRAPHRRRFQIRFLDELAARHFFETYTEEALVAPVPEGEISIDRNGRTFIEMKLGLATIDSSEDDDDNDDDDDDDDDDGDQDEGEGLGDIGGLDLDGNFGESQDLFAPLRPSRWN